MGIGPLRLLRKGRALMNQEVYERRAFCLAECASQIPVPFLPAPCSLLGLLPEAAGCRERHRPVCRIGDQVNDIVKAEPPTGRGPTPARHFATNTRLLPPRRRLAGPDPALSRFAMANEATLRDQQGNAGFAQSADRPAAPARVARHRPDAAAPENMTASLQGPDETRTLCHSAQAARA